MSIDTTIDGHIATITINNPDALNALDVDHLHGLIAAFDDLATQTAIRAVLFEGAGDKAFVAGANIKEMSTMSIEDAGEFGRLGHAVGGRIESLPQPVIAVIQGFALGGGCELALACDMRLASTRAVFAQPEVGLGIPPGWGGTQRLPRLVGKGIASELIFSGRRIKAEEALKIGLVNAVYEPAELQAEARKLAETIAAQSPSAVQLSKKLIARPYGASLQAGLDDEAAAFADVFESPDQREGMRAFVEKRIPAFRNPDSREGA